MSMQLIVLMLTSLCMVFAKNADEITYLPGLLKQPSFLHYSGYLQATGTKMLHYWFVESQNKPTTDPLVLWLNGGPGCSSLDGLLSEHGPYLVQPDGVTLQYNDYSWNAKANVLYLESPAGVGFSYSDDGNYTTNDDLVVEDNYMALKSFFKKYPTYAVNPFFILGESYGGVYVPTLAVKVMDDTAIKLQGFAVGNGVTSYEDLSNALIYFAYYHGLFGTSLWDNLQKYCCTNNGARCNFYNSNVTECQTGVEKVLNVVDNIGLNPYNLYAECVGEVPGNYYTYQTGLEHLFNKYAFANKAQQVLKFIPRNKLKIVPTCLNATAISMYLNDAYVKEALHVKDGLPDWDICSADVGTNYKRVYETLKEQYVKVLGTYNYRILVYNGDVDMACNFLGDEWFIDGLDLEEQVQRRPWLYSDGTDQIAGFVKEFEHLAFATIKGAGHMAPQDKRKATQQLINNFLFKLPY